MHAIDLDTGPLTDSSSVGLHLLSLLVRVESPAGFAFLFYLNIFIDVGSDTQ